MCVVATMLAEACVVPNFFVFVCVCVCVCDIVRCIVAYFALLARFDGKDGACTKTPG